MIEAVHTWAWLRAALTPNLLTRSGKYGARRFKASGGSTMSSTDFELGLVGPQASNPMPQSLVKTCLYLSLPGPC